MATSLQTVRLLTIRARTEGMDRAQAELAGISRAQYDVARAGEAAAKATETGARRAGSVAGSWAKLASEMQGNVKAGKAYADVLRLISQAEEQGVATARDAARARLVEQAKLQNAPIRGPVVDQSGINALLGIRTPDFGAARESAMAFEEALSSTGGVAKLTSNQLLNLSRQGNDVITMFALGASGTQIFASQIGQVTDALQSGPGGLSGSLAAVKAGIISVLTPTTLITAGFVAAGAAALYFINRNDGIDSMTDALAKQGEAIRKLRDAYGEAADAAAAYGRDSKTVVDAEAQRSLASMRQAYIASISKTGSIGGVSRPLGINGFEDVLSQIGPASRGGSTQMGVSSEYRAFAAPILELLDGVKKGTPDVVRFVDEINRLASQNGSAEYQKLAEGLSNMVKEAYEGQKAFELLSKTIEATKVATRNVAEQMKLYRDLAGMIPDLRTEGQRINDTFNDALDGVRSPAEFDSLRRARDAAYSGLNKEANDTLRDERSSRTLAGLKGEAAGVAEVNQRYDRLIETYAGADEAIATLNKAREEAISTIRAEGLAAANDQLRQSEASRSAAGLEGYRAGLAGISTEYARQIELAAGNEDAIRALTRARDLDIETLQVQTQKQLFDPQSSRLATLTAEAAAIGKNADETRRLIDAAQAEEDIRRAGINTLGSQADAYRNNMAALSDYADRIDRVSDAWSTARQAGESAIDSLVGSITSGDITGALKSVADDLSKTLLELAVSNPLKNALFGTSYGTLSDLFNGAGAAPSLSMPGVQSLASATINVGVATIGGAGVSSLLGGGVGSSGGAAGAIEKLLNPANENSASAGLAGNSVKAQVANYFAGKGLASHQIAGILGNVSAESAFNPGARGDGGNALGLFQWNDRSKSMLNSVGSDWRVDVQGQLDFAWKELQTSESGALKRLMASKDVRGATAAFAGFERPSGYSVANPENAHNFSGRLSAAEKSFTEIEGTSKTMASSFAASSGAIGSTLTAFGSSFSSNTQLMLNGMKGSIADFLPQFGGSLSSLISSISGSTGISSSGVAASLANVGGLLGFYADGGMVSGPGSGTSDSVAAMLSNGEFVVNAAATARHRGLLDAINEGRVPRYAQGGFVGQSSSPMQSMAPQGIHVTVAADVDRSGNIVPIVTGISRREAGTQVQQSEQRAVKTLPKIQRDQQKRTG